MTAELPHDAWARLALGNWLFRWRAVTGATQRRVAQLAHIDQSFLSRVERGHRRITGDPLARLVIALDWLSGGGLPEGPFAAMHRPLPHGATAIPGQSPPVVVGTRLVDQDFPVNPGAAWEVAQAALRRGDAPRTSPLQPPTIAEALAIHRSHRRAGHDSDSDLGAAPSSPPAADPPNGGRPSPG
jgi:hypothetical protein